MSGRSHWQETTATPFLVIAGIEATRGALLAAPDYPRRIMTMLKAMASRDGCLHQTILTRDMTSRVILSWWRSVDDLRSWYDSVEHQRIVEYALSRAELAGRGQVRSWIDLYAPMADGTRCGAYWPDELRQDRHSRTGDDAADAVGLLCVGIWDSGTSAKSVAEPLGVPESAWRLHDPISLGSVLLVWSPPAEFVRQVRAGVAAAIKDCQESGASSWIESFEPLDGGIRTTKDAGSPLSNGRILFPLIESRGAEH